MSGGLKALNIPQLYIQYVSAGLESHGSILKSITTRNSKFSAAHT